MSGVFTPANEVPDEQEPDEQEIGKKMRGNTTREMSWNDGGKRFPDGGRRRRTVREAGTKTMRMRREGRRLMTDR